MSFTGKIEAKCPGCSEENEFEIWSFVRGDQDATLRDRLKGGELNVLECPGCGRLFYPETSWVYADPRQGLVAFVFPEAYAAEAERWRGKMREDFVRMRPVTAKMGIDDEPIVFFGAVGLAELIHEVDDLEDEVEVAEWYGKKLGLGMRKVRAGFAREHHLPNELPYGPGPEGMARPALLESVRKLVAANDRLAGYRRWIEYLEGPGGDPPWAGKGG